jgi:predicted HD superfamily hydrolase involved in NAD metabolism
MDPEQFIRLHLKTENRALHSLSTARFMKKHAETFGLSREKAYLAGILHDAAKEMDHQEIIQLAVDFKKRNLIDLKYWEFKLRHPFLLHGTASAELAIRELSITDREVIEACIHHTTGGTQISRLSLFTFVADFCEPSRKFKEAKEVRKILIKMENLELASFEAYSLILKNLIRKRWEICPETIDGYNETRRLCCHEF